VKWLGPAAPAGPAVKLLPDGKIMPYTNYLRNEQILEMTEIQQIRRTDCSRVDLGLALRIEAVAAFTQQ
jgi:hypothetical protein